MANAFDRDGLSACLGANASEGCGSAIQSFITRYQWLDNLTSWFTLVPGLIGVLLAASFVLELENGTYRLAWTQSITAGAGSRRGSRCASRRRSWQRSR